MREFSSSLSSYLLSLCEFVKLYFERASVLSLNTGGQLMMPCGLGANELSLIDQLKIPSTELLRICIDQMQACEVEKFRNLNKLSILINLIGSLLRVKTKNCFFSTDDDNRNVVVASSLISANNSHNRLFIQLIKSLVQVKAHLTYIYLSQIGL
jgi:hypothetical protein